jgi:hypothetical protein
MSRTGLTGFSIPVAIHRQCFHQQVEIAAVVGEEFMRVVGAHPYKDRK